MTDEDYQQLEKRICYLRGDLDILKHTWDERYHRKSAGGISAIGGFHCQFVLFLLETVKAYISRGNKFEDPRIFIECLSDIINDANDNVVILSEVKRTLSSGSVSKALNQLWAVYELSCSLTPNLCSKLRFRILSTRNKLNDARRTITNWTPDGSDWLISDVKDFLERTQVEINARPEEQILALLSNKLNAMRPREVMDHWLAILLRAGEQGNFRSIALDIWQEIRNLRQAGIEQQKPAGIYVWSNSDFPPETIKKGNVITGGQPTVKNLREGYFAQRDNVYDIIANTADLWIGDTAEREAITRLPIFWIGGRSGCGKSVALLHILASLYDSGWGPILYLGNKVDLIPLAINWAKHIVSKEILDSPVIIAVDDPYSPTSYQDAEKIWQKGLAGLEDLFQSGSVTEIPMLLCCGPTEQAERLQDDFFSDVVLTLHEMPIESKTDYENLRSWYRNRVGKEPPEIGDENVLLIQLFFEWEVGSSLREFGKRFLNRIQDMDREVCRDQRSENTIVSILSKILSLNRFYTGYPEKAFNNFITPDIEQHVSLLRDEHHHLEIRPHADRKGYWIAHPHLSNSIFESWYPAHKVSRQREILQDAIIDCIRWGANPSEQMAPLWALSQLLFSKEEALKKRLPYDQALNLLKSLYDHWPLSEDDEMPLAHLPVWIQLSVQCPELGITPDPADVAIKRVTIDNLDKKGLRLTCHKLLEHYFSFSVEKQKQVNDSIYQLLSTATDWVEWAAVVQDAIFRTKDSRYCSLIVNWIIENSLSKKAPNLLLAALRIFPSDPILQKAACGLLNHAGPEIVWGDIAIQLLENNGNDLPPKEVITWTDKYQTEFESCFLLGRLLHKKVAPTSKYALVWLRKFHLEPSANYVFEPFILTVDEISEEVLKLCINNIEKGYNTSERLLELLINKFPKDQKLRLLGLNLLDKIPDEIISWCFLWKALMQANPDEEIIGLGKDWLKKGLIHHKSWRHIWEELWLYAKDQTLFDLATQWLDQVPFSNASWGFVWKNLWDYNDKDNLSHLGRKWLKEGPPYHPTWKFVWEPLWDNSQDTELIELAENWLKFSIKENEFWGIVWEHLWNTKKNDRLALLGMEWLIQKFENSSWSHVWSLLWDYHKDESLSKLGLNWLSHRIGDQGWGFVWKTLWEASPSEDLISHGKKWLVLTPFDQGSWSYIWQRLWPSCKGEELAERGKEWLGQTSFSNPSWGHVWEKIWNYSKEDGLVDIGKEWLSTTAVDQGSWGYVWKNIWKWNVTAGRQDYEIIELGKKWINHAPLEHKLWGYVWQGLWVVSRDDTLMRIGKLYLENALPQYDNYKKYYIYIKDALKNYEYPK